ncbi:MAG TPA: PadR family transcriptional regulator, partial [Gemmiger qucibialis]|nr:PadR family transcriptional regulator [Gemmiger qucibialis]
PFNGRNRRYYKITPLGRQQLAGYKAEWKVYAANIDHIFGEDAK